MSQAIITWKGKVKKVIGMGGKVEKPRPVKANVKDLTDQYSDEINSIRTSVEYTELQNSLEKAKKSVKKFETQNVMLSQEPGLSEQYEEGLNKEKEKLTEAEKKLKPFEDKIKNLESQANQVEKYLEDPSTAIDPEIKHGVDLRAEKPVAMNLLKEQVDQQFKEAKEDPQYLKLKKELEKQQKSLNEYKEEEKRKSSLRNDEMFQKALKEVEAKVKKSEQDIRPLQNKVDVLEKQAKELKDHLDSGETTGLPPELQNTVNQKAESAVLFRDVQDQIEKDIAAKQNDINNILAEPEIAKVYKPLKDAQERLQSLEKQKKKLPHKHSDALDPEIERAKKDVESGIKAMAPYKDRLNPLEKEKVRLNEMSALVNQNLENMSFDLDPGDELAAQLQYRVDKKQVESAGLDFKEKAAEVLIREPAVVRARAKVKAATEKQDTARNALDEAVKKTPALKGPNDKAEEAKKALEEKTKAQEAAMESLQNKAKEYQKLYEEIQSGDPAEQFAKLEKLNSLSAELDEAKQGMRDANMALGEANTTAESAQKALDEAIAEQAKSNQGGDLAKAQTAFEDARGEASKAEEEQQKAEKNLENARAAAKAAEGRKKVLEELPQIRETMSAIKDDLNNLTKEGLVIWNEGGADAIRKKLGDKKFKELEETARKLQSQYETLKSNGATTEELEALYKNSGIDEKWWPPQFRKEEQNWLAMKEFITDEDIQKRAGEETKKIDTVISTLSTGEDLASYYGTAMSFVTSEIGQQVTEKIFKFKLTEEQTESVSKFVALGGAIAGMGKSVTSTGKGGQELVQNKEVDPIEEMMLQDELLEAMGEMAKSGLELTGEVVKMLWKELPAIGVVSDAIDVMKSLKETAERIANAMEDSRIFEEAQIAENQGEKAFAQFANRDKHLAARAGADTAFSALSAASGVVTMTGVGAKAGVAMKAVASGGKFVKGRIEWAVDKTAAQTAKNLLEKAQAGNAEARSELFQHHPRYAKGLISLMAMEGDPLALACLQNHGLSEEMIAKSSAPIIKKYLLKRFKETDDPSSWTDTWNSIKGAASTVASGASAVGGFFTGLYNKIYAAIQADKPAGLLAALKVVEKDMPDMNKVGAAVGPYQSLRFRRDGLAATASEEDKNKIKELDDSLTKAREKVQELRTNISGSNALLAELHGKVQTQLKTNSGNKDLQDSKALAESLLRKHMQALDVVVSSL